MKRGGKMLVWLAGGLAWGIAATTTMAVGAGNPYEAIVERNVFGLKPPPPPPDPEANKPPLPKLSLTGIVTFGGAKRALLKTAAGPPRPGQPASQPDSFIISVGERQGDIEVLSIDEKAGVVKVNYGGAVSDLDFENDGIKAPPAAAPPPARPTPGVVPLPPTKTVTALPGPAGAHGAVPTPFPTRTLRTGSTATSVTPQAAVAGGGLPPAVNVGGARLSFASGGQSHNPVAEQQAALPQRSLEENLLMLEANRLRHQEEIQAGRYPPLPRHPLMEEFKADEAAKAGLAPQ